MQHPVSVKLEFFEDNPSELFLPLVNSKIFILMEFILRRSFNRQCWMACIIIPSISVLSLRLAQDPKKTGEESSAPPKNGDQYSNLWFDTSLPKGRQNRDKQHESINVRKREKNPTMDVEAADGRRKLRLDIFITFQWILLRMTRNWTFTIYFLLTSSILATLFEILFFVQKFNFDFPWKLSIFWGEKLVKMLWFWTF